MTMTSRSANFIEMAARKFWKSLFPRLWRWLIRICCARQAGIADQFIQDKLRTTERVLFRKAVYDDTLYGKTVPLSYVPVGENSDFVQLVTRIFDVPRTSAGTARFQRPIARKDSRTAGLIERYLDKAYAAKQAEAAVKPIIRIDAEKLTALQQESEYVRQALTIEEDVEQVQEAASFEHQAEVEGEASESVKLMTELKRITRTRG